MIVPRNRLIAMAATLVPFALIAAAAPSLKFYLTAAALILAATAVADAASGVLLPAGISFSLPPLTRMSLNRPCPIRIRITHSRLGGRSVAIARLLPPSFAADVETLQVGMPAAPAATVEWTFTPLMRGTFRISACAFEIASPMGLWSIRGRAPCNGEVRVYPNVEAERKRLAPLFLRKDTLGTRLQRMAGHGREFERLREYAPGDNYDDIHWKATARRSRPITKVYQIERTREIYACVDCSRVSARPAGNEPAIERFMTAALILGLVANEYGDLFGVATFSDRIHSFRRAGKGRAHFNACREALYSVHAQKAPPDFQELFSFIRVRLRRRALVMLLTDLSDPVVAEDFVRSARIVARHHLVCAVMIRPTDVAPVFAGPTVETLDDVYRRLAGHVMWLRMSELQRTLGRMGANMTVAQSEGLAIEMVSHYLSVKSRQLL